MPSARRYPPIYERDPSGPSISYEDLLKTAASCQALLALLNVPQDLTEKEQQLAIKQIGKQATAAIGRQWSLVTAMQYLTGQKADKAATHWMDELEGIGLHRRHVDALIALANDYCANLIEGKTLSTGLLVAEYKKRPLGPEAILELLDLPPDLVHTASLSGAAAT